MSEANDSNNVNMSPTSVSAGRVSCASGGAVLDASVAAAEDVVLRAAEGSDAAICDAAAGAGASGAVDAPGSADAAAADAPGSADAPAVDAPGSADVSNHQTAPRKTFFQAIKYLVVGGSSAVIELVLFQLLSAVFAIPLAAANVTAVVVSTVFNFLVNRNVTFKSTSNPLRSLVLYLILFVLNTTFSTVVISLLAAQGVYPLVAKVCTMACIVLWNFVLYKKVIFK